MLRSALLRGFFDPHDPHAFAHVLTQQRQPGQREADAEQNGERIERHVIS